MFCDLINMYNGLSSHTCTCTPGTLPFGDTKEILLGDLEGALSVLLSQLIRDSPDEVCQPSGTR